MSFILPVKMDQEVNSIVYMQEMYVKTSTRIFSSVPILISVILFLFLYIHTVFRSLVRDPLLPVL